MTCEVLTDHQATMAIEILLAVLMGSLVGLIIAAMGNIFS